ncbi:MAG: hypothetical protein MI861_08895, partial [Pirellulales bacterium]|nr:hypothetical protein [Pirellulales bacterium]
VPVEIEFAGLGIMRVFYPGLSNLNPGLALFASEANCLKQSRDTRESQKVNQSVGQITCQLFDSILTGFGMNQTVNDDVTEMFPRLERSQACWLQCHPGGTRHY